MDLRHLRYFLAVAEAGHMTRAAASLGIQQPPLSQQIKALEAELGMSLFHRHPKGVSLTDNGQVFLAETRRLLADVEAMKLRMAGLAQGLQGTLNVGFTSSAAAHAFTPQALRACRSRYPDIALVLSESNAAEITEAVEAERLHVGFVRVPVARPAGLCFDTLLSEPVVVALPVDHPLAGQTGPLHLKDLQDQPLILARRTGAAGLYANLLALCEAQGVRTRVVAEVDRMMTNLNLVAAGAGITVVPTSMEGAHPHAIAYRSLADAAQLEAPLTLVYRARDCTGPTATLVNLVREIAAQQTAPTKAGTSRRKAPRT